MSREKGAGSISTRISWVVLKLDMSIKTGTEAGEKEANSLWYSEPIKKF
jgi:hypothetical protein